MSYIFKYGVVWSLSSLHFEFLSVRIYINASFCYNNGERHCVSACACVYVRVFVCVCVVSIRPSCNNETVY